MWFVVINRDTGEAVSIGTVVADPLPLGLVAVAITEADADALNKGRGLWDAATRSVVMRPEAEWPVLPE
jgi:hypothetical protein